MEAWRLRANINSLAICALLVLVAVLFKVNHDQSASINQSRVEVCRDQNAQRAETIRRLDARIAELPPAQRLRAERSREFTVSLIDALAPRRDCRALTE